MKLYTKCLCRTLSLPLFIVRMVRIPEEGYPRDLWRGLFEKFKPLGSECILEQRNSGGVAPRSTEARDKTKLLRIGAADEYERDRFIKLFCNWSDVYARLQSGKIEKRARKSKEPQITAAP